jgi:serpin B
MVKRTALVLSAALLASACASSSSGHVDGTTAPAGTVRFPANAQLAVVHEARAPGDANAVPALVTGNSAFAFDLYQRLAAGDHGNLVFSPASISNAISMLEGGAKGATLEQIDTTMHYALPGSKLQDAFDALDQMLAAPRHAASGEKGTPLKLEQTDAVWGQRGYPFVQAYLDLLARDYGAGLRLADFAKHAETERVKINEYVSSATHGKIKDLFPKGVIDSMTRMVLVNAIWFKGDWVTPFQYQDTIPRSFTRLDGTTVQVSMMGEGHTSRSFASADYDAVEMPYTGGASMVIIEPAAGEFAAIEQHFGAAMLAAFERAPQPIQYEVSMPKFSFASQFSLKDTLSAMGMRDVFDGRADLSGIDGTRNLYVSAVVHQATITVDEQGTEAAAATGSVAEVMEGHPSITIDHPFLFAIRDDATGAILFAGRVLDPSQH